MINVHVLVFVIALNCFVLVDHKKLLHVWRKAGQSCDSPLFLCPVSRELPVIPDPRPHFLLLGAEVSSPQHSNPFSMDADYGNKSKKPFACDVCDHRFTTTGSMRSHKQAVHGHDVFKCPQPGCQFSSSWKISLSHHLKGIHGTTGSYACDHPGCTFRSMWMGNIVKHKRHVHSDERPFACDHTGCSFRAKTRGNLLVHTNAVHLNIMNKRCHLCRRGFLNNSRLRDHMATHEGNGHEVAKCEDCSVSLTCRSYRPTVGKLFPCDHQGCDYKSGWKGSLLSHQKHAHSEERPFSCSHTGCSYRSKTKSNLTNHQDQVHLKIKTKRCHVCDKRFFVLGSLRAHMMSHHQTNDHDIAHCDNCVTHPKKNHKQSQARMASLKRRVGKGRTHSTTVNRQGIQSSDKNAEDKEGNSFVSKEVGVKTETTDLNDELIDIHVNMQLL